MWSNIIFDGQVCEWSKIRVARQNNTKLISAPSVHVLSRYQIEDWSIIISLFRADNR